MCRCVCVPFPPLLFQKISTAAYNISAYQHVIHKHFVSHQFFKIARRKKKVSCGKEKLRYNSAVDGKNCSALRTHSSYNPVLNISSKGLSCFQKAESLF